jgi:hypothetical protein
MGGYGSGRYFPEKKNKVGDGLSLDANRFSKWQYFKQGMRYGNLTWSRGEYKRGACGFRVNIDGANDSITFSYRYNDAPHPDVRVPLSWYEPGFGGRRYLFVCPRCGKRMRTLHVMAGEIGCRVCYDLTYESCVENNRFNGLYKYMAVGLKASWQDVKQYMNDLTRRAHKEPKRPRGRPKKQRINSNKAAPVPF